MGRIVLSRSIHWLSQCRFIFHFPSQRVGVASRPTNGRTLSETATLLSPSKSSPISLARAISLLLCFAAVHSRTSHDAHERITLNHLLRVKYHIVPSGRRRVPPARPRRTDCTAIRAVLQLMADALPRCCSAALRPAIALGAARRPAWPGLEPWGQRALSGPRRPRRSGTYSRAKREAVERLAQCSQQSGRVAAEAQRGTLQPRRRSSVAVQPTVRRLSTRKWRERRQPRAGGPALFIALAGIGHSIIFLLPPGCRPCVCGVCPLFLISGTRRPNKPSL